MRRRRFTPGQIIKILKEAESDFNNKDICRKYGISEQTFYNWRNKYGGMSIKEARRLKALEEENRQLKRLVADLSLDNQILKDLLEKNS
jgi:putative transposase